MNPFARTLRKDKTLRARLRSLIGKRTAVIETQTAQDMLDALTRLAEVRSLHDVTVYVVGGDGTFNQVLNWALTQSEDRRPHLMPVGGGQFNFMTKHVGLKSTDPSVNLAEIFSGEIRLTEKSWKPIRIEDSLSGEHRYAAVAANGILCDVVEWYEENGKGDMVDVAKLIMQAIADFTKNQLHGTYGRIKPTHGKIRIDGTELPCSQYGAFMLGTVSEFLPGCKPFLSPPDSETFSAMVYWGGFAALAMSVPMIWKGWASPLTDLRMFNDSAHHVEIQTQDDRLLIDGDLIKWPTDEPGTKRTLRGTYGPQVSLLTAT